MNIAALEHAKHLNAERLCVVFADMVGYSALCSIDEHGTHRTWMDFNEKCIVPTAARHDANAMRLLGDGCLLSFQTADAALAWCMEVRETLVADRIGGTARWPQLSMRFGAHLCDVIHENGDIYGDGVNITKRLQERAESDGILVSATFRDAVSEEAAPVETRFLGELEYKNIARPVPTFEIVLSNRTLSLRNAGKDLPSIAVLPFDNVSGDRSFDYFCEGVIDDVIHSLASFNELQVIARASTLPFSGRSVDARDIARILSVRYVLKGTLRRGGSKLRLAVTLEDAVTGDVVMSQTSDFSHSTIFEVQDNLVRQIVGRVTPGVRALELETALRKPPSSFTAYQSFLRALDLMKSADLENYRKAREMLDRAIELDPKFSLAYAWIVRWYCVMLGQRWIEDREEAIEAANDFARRGLSIDRDNAMVLGAFGHVKSYLQHDYETAMVYFDRARQLAPGNALVWILSSATLSYLGRGDEAVEHAQRALQLSPNDPDLYQFYDFASIAHMTNGDLDAALVWAKLSHAENPQYSSNLKQLVSINAALGKLEEAEKYAGSLLRLEPNFSVSSYRDLCPLQHRDRVEHYADLLAKGGLPA
ncbi:hypothetical protein N9H93_00570 [Rhizobiaceae bacterium]|nr:hypothetical protein [Rhizobiaceae bacterium]